MTHWDEDRDLEQFERDCHLPDRKGCLVTILWATYSWALIGGLILLIDWMMGK
jgi:hypothetical protein